MSYTLFSTVILSVFVRLLSFVDSALSEFFVFLLTESLLQLKLDEVHLEMMALMQVMPHWEGGNDVNSSVKGHLSEMIKRVMGEIDNGPDFGSSESSFSSLDRPASADAATIKSEKDLSLLSDTGTPREHSNSSADRPRSQPDDSQAVASMRDFLSSPLKADTRVSTDLESFTYQTCRRIFCVIC